MKILVTGAQGFVGRNLCAQLSCIRDGKDHRVGIEDLLPVEIVKCDSRISDDELDRLCAEVDFVYNLAGVNRPDDPSEFTKGNVEFASRLIDSLERCGNCCPAMLASSIQATLEGRFAGSEYGRSKRAAEKLFFEHAERTGSRVVIYRFPNLYGKWCRPNYNSVVATFCHNVARGLPLRIDNPETELELLYIDDVVDELISALVGEESSGEDGFCKAGPTDLVTLGKIADLLCSFRNSRTTIEMPDATAGSFTKKLHATYLSYLDPTRLSYSLEAHRDERGSFTEFLRSADRGQISVNVSAPGIVKGNHWHRSKWEKFFVVSGEALIRLRRVGLDSEGKPHAVTSYRVNGEEPVVVEMAPGYTHSIANVSQTRDLITLMWANEPFDRENPDTFYEEV